MKEQLEQGRIFNTTWFVKELWNKNIYLKEPWFNDVYSRNNLSKIKDGAYVKNHDQCKSIGSHWIAFYVNGNNTTYSESFEVEEISKKIKETHRKRKYHNKTVIAYNYIMCRYCSLGFIEITLIYTLRTNMKRMIN